MTYEEYKKLYEIESNNAFNTLRKLNEDFIRLNNLFVGKFVYKVYDGNEKKVKFVIKDIQVDNTWSNDFPNIVIRGSKVSKNGNIGKATYQLEIDSFNDWLDEYDDLQLKSIGDYNSEQEGIIPYVYLIDSFDYYKIGFSKNPIQRLKQIQSHSATKCEILYMVVDDGGLEKKLHAKFKNLRSHGEWFKKDRSIIDEFKRLNTTIETEKYNYIQGYLFESEDI